MKYRNCKDYWLDESDCSFRGEFEAMYADIEDPWGCSGQAHSLNNSLFLELLFHQRSFKRILDVGCGLGAFTDLIYRRGRPIEKIIGCDISKTAITKAQSRYNHIEFKVLDILADDTSCFENFDLMVFSEILWYVLSGLDTVFKKAIEALTRDGILGFHQFFPSRQRFGKDVINGIGGFDDYMSTTPFIPDRRVISRTNDGEVLLATYRMDK